MSNVAKRPDTAKEQAQYKEWIENNTRYYNGKYQVLILEKTNKYNYLVVVLDDFCISKNNKFEKGQKFKTTPTHLYKGTTRPNSSIEK